MRIESGRNNASSAARLVWHLAAAAALAVLLGLCWGSGVAQAATVTVTSTSDSGTGSLRQAITEASGGDTIVIPAGVYRLNSILTVNKALTFAGAGARVAILDGQRTTQIFSLEAPAATVTITGLTLRNGETTSENGGAIVSTVPLTLNEDAIVGNTTTGSGGGVFIAAQLTMNRDLVAGNTASQDGGGIELEPLSPSTSAISDTTIAENSALPGAGGGIDELNSSTETLELFNDSLVGNASSQGGDFRAWSNTTIAFRNTLFAQSSAPSGPTCEYGGGATVTSLGHNAQDVNDANCHFGPTDLASVTPNLGTLQNNGGPTDTMLPASGSPLIDAGDTAHCTAQDQRGVSRPQGLGCDIGAVERTMPTAGTPAVSGITSTGATLTASAGAIFLGGSFSYRFGPTVAYGSGTPLLPLLPGVVGEPVSAALTGLTPATTYHVQLLVFTPDGTVASNDATFSTAATTTTPPTTSPPIPSVTGVRQSTTRWRAGNRLAQISRRKKKLPVGTTFSFSLNEQASISFSFTQQVVGRKVGSRCVAKTRNNSRRKSCNRIVTAGQLSFSGHAGLNKVVFQGLLPRAPKLKPGRYTLTIIATNSAGSSAPAGLTFTIEK